MPPRAKGDDDSIIDDGSRRTSLLVGAGGDEGMLSGSGDKEEFGEDRWMSPGGGRLNVTNPDQ